MRPTLFPVLFRQENVKLLRYLGGGTKNLEFNKAFHTRFIVSNQFSQDDLSEINALIDVYSEFDQSRLVCNQMNKQNIVSGHFHNGFAFEVVTLFKSMVSDQDKSCTPNEYISGLALSSCLDVGYLLLGRQCHGYLLKSGLVLNQYVKTALVRLYSMSSDVVGALEVLLCNLRLDTCSYNHILVGLVEKGYLDEALSILKRMLAEDMAWNKDTYIGVLGLCARLLDFDLGRQVHNKLLKSDDVEFDESVGSAVINMYAKCEEMTSAIKAFKMFEPGSVVIRTALMAAFSENRSFEASLYLLFEMRHEDVVPNESTFSVLLNVSAELFSMRCGSSLHALAEKTGFKCFKNVEDTLIDMYSRTGNIKAAEKVFSGMTYNRDVVTWNMMIGGYCYHGLGHESLALFDEMLNLGEDDPNSATFVAVLSACGHVGLVEQGFYYLYELMKQKGVKPGLDHYMCIINMLIKAGQLTEALSFILSTPSKWDVFAWTALLSGCRAHRSYTLGIRIADLIPDDVATDVSKWCGVAQVRELMEIRDNIKEERGLSWVELGDETYSFTSVENGDPGFDELHEFMKGLLSGLNFINDSSDTDVDYILREDCNGGYHSEELAVAFALSTTHMTPIYIIKASGKICGSCHSLMKFISNVTQRLITVRDAYHFHNFYDGHCSCADYW